MSEHLVLVSLRYHYPITLPSADGLLLDGLNWESLLLWSWSFLLTRSLFTVTGRRTLMSTLLLLGFIFVSKWCIGRKKKKKSSSDELIFIALFKS